MLYISKDLDVSTLVPDTSVTEVAIEITSNTYKTRADEIVPLFTNLTTVHFYDDGSVTTFNNMFNGGNDTCKNKVANINFLSGYFENLTSLNFAFYKCSGAVRTIDITNLSHCKLTNIERAFQDCYSVTEIKAKGLDVSNITSFYLLFGWCWSLESLDLSGWDTRNVRGMRAAFRGMKKLKTLDLTGWDLSGATEFLETFRECLVLSEIKGLENLNVSNVQSLESTFCDCNNLTSINLSNWDTSKVTNLLNTFNGCTSLISLDISNFDMTKVNNLSTTFSRCTSLADLKIKNIKLPTSTNFDISSFTSLQKIDVTDLSMEDVNTIMTTIVDRTNLEPGVIYYNDRVDREMMAHKNWTFELSILVARYTYDNSNGDIFPRFNSGYSYTYTVVDNGDGTSTIELRGSHEFGSISFESKSSLLSVDKLYVTSDCTSLEKLFSSCSRLTSVNTEGWDSSNVRTMRHSFLYCGSLSEIDLSNIDTRNVTNMDSTFQDCGLTVMNVENWNVEQVSNMNCLFRGTRVESLDLSRWNTLSVNNINSIFVHCTKLRELNVSGWKTSNISNMNGIFSNCSALTSLDLSSWDTHKVGNMNSMFLACSALTQLNLKNFNTSNCNSFVDMFSGCTSLESLDLSSFDTSRATNMSCMFQNCKSLESLDLSSFKTGSLTNLNRTFQSCSSMKMLDLSNFDTSRVANFNGVFSGCGQLSEIGMLYCKKNTVDSLLNYIKSTNQLEKKVWLIDTDINEMEELSNIVYMKGLEYEHEILVPCKLMKVENVRDKLYYDESEGKYIIEKNVHIPDGIEEINESFILSEPQIIQTKISDKIIVPCYGEDNVSVIAVKSNNYSDAKNIHLKTNSIKYTPTKLKPNTLYTVQLNYIPSDITTISANLGGTIQDIDISEGDYTSIEITTPSNLATGYLELIGRGIQVSNVMLFNDSITQTPEYFDGVENTGIVQDEGNYKIDICSNDDFIVSILMNKPLLKGHRLYWNKSNKRYEIDRNGEIEVPTVNGDIIDLPRLYQKNGTNIRVETGNINPSVIEIEYIDIN